MPDKAKAPAPKVDKTAQRRITKVLQALDVGKGAEVVERECPIHGLTPAIRIQNKGGHNSTYTCLKCAAEINAAMKV